MTRNMVLFIALVLSLFGNSLAVPPDTLDFGFVRYYKAQSLLCYDPVQAVTIRTETRQSYPSTVVFRDSIMFLTSEGAISRVDSLPVTLSLNVTQSQSGKYIYIFGPHSDRPGGFHALYEYNGNRIFARDDSTRAGLSGYGLPLEKAKQFLLARNGVISLTSFEGKKANDVILLNKELYEDGDILLSITPDEKKIFAAVNKFKMPKPEAGPELVAFDSKLRVMSRQPLPYLLVISLQCSSDGKFLILRVELADGGSPVIVTDSSGNEVLRLDNPQSAKFSADGRYLFNVKRSAKAEILEAATWNSVFAPSIPVTGFTWMDSDISGDGNIAAFFEGNRLLVASREMQASGHIMFPYAFKTVRLLDHGKRMVFSGEFGAVVYQMIDE